MTEEFEVHAKIVLNALQIYNQDDVKKVYHFLVKKLHPDNTNGDEIYFKNLQMLYNFFDIYIQSAKDIKLAKGDFSYSLNYILKSCNGDIKDYNVQKLIYESLIEYSNNINNKSLSLYLTNVLKSIELKEQRVPLFLNYQKKIIDYVTSFTPNNLNEILRDFPDPHIAKITKQAIIQINELIQKTTITINKLTTKEDIDNYLNSSFINNYKLIIISYIKESLSYDNNFDIKYINECSTNLDNNLKLMTIENVYNNLKQFKQDNQIKKEQEAILNENEIKNQLIFNRNKTKGILNHLLKSNFISKNDFITYYFKFHLCRTVENYQDIYQELYEKYYYDNEISLIKNRTINQFYNYIKTNKKTDSLTYVNILQRVLTDVDSYPNKINSKTLRQLAKIDFNNIEEIDNILSSLEEPEIRK